MKTNESLGADTKSQFKIELSKNSNFLQSGLDGIIAADDFKNAIPESNDFVKIKKPLKKNIVSKLVTKKNINKPISKLKTEFPIMGEEGETNEMDSSSAGGYSSPLFSTTKKEIQEKCWDNYEQKGMKKQKGRMVPNCVKEGRQDYCDFCDNYKSECDCSQTNKIEATEATDSSSSGQYSTTSIWAKSTNKKDWRGKSKTQIPGGKFVQVKKKCKKFPYCNQGDIKALKIFENEKIKIAIRNISQRHNISENVIKIIIAYEYENTFFQEINL